MKQKKPTQSGFQIHTHRLRCYRRKYYFKCKEKNCQKTFNTLKTWNVHHQIHHKTILKCEICPKRFRIQSSFRVHQNVHVPNKFICESCGKLFPFNSALCIHKRVHSNQRKFHCFARGCKKTYKWPQDLHQHVQKHLNRRYPCPDCDYVTKEKRLLPRHMVKHSDTYKYACPHCKYKGRYYTPYH